MVLMQMTPFIVDALNSIHESHPAAEPGSTEPSQETHHEPSLKDPKVGNPISHRQILHLWQRGKTLSTESAYSLENLLKTSAVYVPPPPPKPEPSPEYKALMARLRREEEARQYSRMVSQPEAFPSRFPSSGNGNTASFASANQPHSKADLGDDDVTLDEVHRQVTLIINILASIVGVAGTLWYLARWWPTPSRLFLAMGGSLLVAVAEWAVYSGYVWRMGEGKKQEDKRAERREVVQTWVVGKEDEKDVVIVKEKQGGVKGVRKRITAGGKT